MKFYCVALVDCPYKYAICLSEKKLKKELKRLNVGREQWPDFISSGKEATVHFLENPNQGNYAIVCIKQPKDGITTEQIEGLIIHEAVHIWQESKELIGERSPSREFEAYSIQRIAQDLITDYRRKTSQKEGTK